MADAEGDHSLRGFEIEALSVQPGFPMRAGRHEHHTVAVLAASMIASRMSWKSTSSMEWTLP